MLFVQHIRKNKQDINPFLVSVVLKPKFVFPGRSCSERWDRSRDERGWWGEGPAQGISLRIISYHPTKSQSSNHQLQPSIATICQQLRPAAATSSCDQWCNHQLQPAAATTMRQLVQPLPACLHPYRCHELQPSAVTISCRLHLNHKLCNHWLQASAKTISYHQL